MGLSSARHMVGTESSLYGAIFTVSSAELRNVNLSFIFTELGDLRSGESF